MHYEVASNHKILSYQYTSDLQFYIPANADNILNLTLLSCSYRTPCRNYLVSFVLSYLILSYLYSKNVPDNLMPDTCPYLFDILLLILYFVINPRNSGLNAPCNCRAVIGMANNPFIFCRNPLILKLRFQCRISSLRQSDNANKPFVTYLARAVVQRGCKTVYYRSLRKIKCGKF